MRILTVILGVSMLSLASGPASAACNKIGRFTFNNGAFPMWISVKAGSACEETFGSFGSINMTFKKLWLARKPDRGSIKLREGGYYIYTAPKAPGPDSFQLRVCGTTNGQDGCADLQFAVQVD